MRTKHEFFHENVLSDWETLLEVQNHFIGKEHLDFTYNKVTTSYAYIFVIHFANGITHRIYVYK